MVKKPTQGGPDAGSCSTGEERALYAERVRLLYENSRSGVTATLVNGLLVVFLQRAALPVGLLALWLAALGLVTALRVVLLRRFRRRSPSEDEIRPWAGYFVCAAGLSGAFWGAVGLFFFRPESLAHQAFLAFVLGGMVAGAASAYAPLLTAYFAFSVPALLPVTVCLASAGEELPLAMAGMVVLFFAMMALIASRGRSVASASLRLRFENAGLVDVLRQEKERVEEVVVERTAGLTAAYEQLQRAKVEWEKTFDAVPDLIALIDADSRIRRLNRAFALRLGVEPKDAVGLGCCRALHGTESPPADCPHAKLLEDRVAHDGEIYSEALGRHYLVSASPLHPGEGEADGAVLVARDITHLKRVERDLVAERNRLEVTVESIGEAVVVTDAEGRVTLLNPVAETLTGFTAAQAAGRPLRELVAVVDEHTRESEECPASSVLRTGTPVECPGAILLPRGGTERVVAMSTAPVRDRDGTLIGTVLVFRDITEQRRLEEEVNRTQHLEALGVLAGGIAHDFNNLLTAIAGNIYRAREGSSDPKSSAYLARAEEACFQAEGLTRQLLTFARGGEPVRKVFDLRAGLPEWVEFALRGARVRAEVELAPDLNLLEADERQLQQVVSNLVINAQQAMPRGGVVRVSARNERLGEGGPGQLPAGSYVNVCVEDQGSGIPPEHLPRIFDPYFTTKAGGTGLGLSTAYSIVKRHGGEIEVRSQPAKGTAFCVHLPASEKRLPAQEPPPAPSQRGSGRLLVMDDERAIRDLLADILPQLGYEAEFASDGAEAVERYLKAAEEGHPFDGVLLDLTVPGGMGGKEALERLQHLVPEVKAIATSGYAADPVLADPARFGFAGVLAKPYRIAELARVLQRVLTAA